MSFELQLEKLGADYTLEDAFDRGVVEAVVWQHEDTIRTKTLDFYDLESLPGEYNLLRAFQVTSDPEAWFGQQCNKGTGWVVEIYPLEGDYLIEDTKTPSPDKFGSEISNKILITSRKALVEGQDYEVTMELSEDDIIEDEEEEDYGDFDEYHDYGLEDDDFDDED